MAGMGGWGAMAGQAMGEGQGQSNAMMAYGIAQADRDRYNRQILYNNLVQALDDNQWIMAHYPNFWSTPQVTNSYTNPMADQPATNYAMSRNASQAAQQAYSSGKEGWQSAGGAVDNYQSQNAFYNWQKGQGGGAGGGYSSLWS